MDKSITDIATFVKERFGTRVYGLPRAPMDYTALISSRVGIRRMIDRMEYRTEKESDPEVISKIRDEVKRLRVIRNDLKKHLKQL